MDTIIQQRNAVKQVIEQYANFKSSHGDIRLDTVFDENCDRYALIQVGWDRGKRINGTLIYVIFHEGQIWIEYDGMERGITDDLIAAGIAKDQIVLGWLPNFESSPFW